MLSKTRLLLALEKERGMWKRSELQTDVIKGIRFGLFIASRIVREVNKETERRTALIKLLIVLLLLLAAYAQATTVCFVDQNGQQICITDGYR